jgi:hypothetical protein
MRIIQEGKKPLICDLKDFENIEDFPALSLNVPTIGYITTDHFFNHTGGTTVSEPIAFQTNAGECTGRITVEHVAGTSSGSITYTAASQRFAQAGNADYIISIELNCALSVAWGMQSGSNLGSESRIFLEDNPVTTYIQGPGGINLTLPYVGAWNNNNNPAISAFGFDASNTFTFRGNGNQNVTSVFRIFLLQGPSLEQKEACEAIKDLACDVNVLKQPKLCDGPMPWEPLDINGGTLVDGTTYTFNTPSTLIDLGQGTIEHGNSEELIATFSGPVDFSFTSAVAPTTRVSWHELNGVATTATTDGSNWCFNEGSVPIQIDELGQVVQASAGASGVDGNDDWGRLTTFNATEAKMMSLVFDAYNYEARPAATKVGQDICEVVDDLCNKMKVALQPADAPDATPPSSVTSSVTGNVIAEHDDGQGVTTDIQESVTTVSQDLAADTITYTDEAGNDTVLDLEKYCYTLWTIQFEDNSALASGALEWSIGNGSEGAINIVVPRDSEIIDMSLSSEIGGTSLSVGVRVNDSVAQVVQFTGQHDFVNLATPIPVTAGQRIGLQTGTEVGAYTDARVAIFLRTKVPV